MPQNTKDSNGGKNKPTQNTGANGGKHSGKHSDKGSADSKPGSPVGSQNKGKKKTTP